MNSNNENYFWQHYTGEVDTGNHFIIILITECITSHSAVKIHLLYNINIVCTMQYQNMEPRFIGFFKENYYANAIFLQDIHNSTQFNFIPAILSFS